MDSTEPVDRDTLAEILARHRAWVEAEKPGGDPRRADLRKADLSRADLSGAVLRWADLSRADLSGAVLRWADLSGADLHEADLRGADLRGVDLSRADLRGADLRGADLHEADLRGASLNWANLYGASLRKADLCEASLHGANLRGVDVGGADLREADLSEAKLNGVIELDPLAAARLEILPRIGEVRGWKSCQHGVMVEVVVPDGVERSNASGHKCRARAVRVVAVHGAEVGISIHDGTTAYRVGEVVECDRWEADRWVECGGGIHFFLTREEAEDFAG